MILKIAQIYTCLNGYIPSISGQRDDRASATETINSGLNPPPVKQNSENWYSLKISIHSFLARRSAIKGTV